MSSTPAQFTALQAPRSTEPAHAALEKRVAENLLMSYEKLRLLQVDYDPAVPGAIRGVKNTGDGPALLDRAQDIAHQWVNSGQAAQYIEQAKAGRAQFLSLAQDKPQEAYNLVEMAEQTRQMAAMSRFTEAHIADKIQSGSLVGLSDPSTATDSDRSLAAIRTLSKEVQMTMALFAEDKNPQAQALLDQLSQTVDGPANLQLAHRKLTDSQKSLSNLVGDSNQQPYQVQYIAQVANETLTKVAGAYPDQVPDIVDFLQSAQRLEDSFSKEGKVGYPAYKDFNTRLEALQESFQTLQPTATEQALTVAKGLIGEIQSQSQAYGEQFSAALEAHAPALSQNESGTALMDNAQRMGFLGALAETSSIFQAAKDAEQPLSASEKAAMMPAVAEVLNSSTLLQLPETQTARAEQVKSQSEFPVTAEQPSQGATSSSSLEMER